jgi:DNA-binding XRE family transcriptional regulator
MSATSDAGSQVLDATSATFRRLSDQALERAKNLGQTDEERANRMGVSRRTYYRLQAGRHDIHLSLAGKVARVLGMTIDAAFQE